MKALPIGAGLAASLFSVVIFYAVAVEPFAIERQEIRVAIRGLPGAFEGYRILHLSDFEAEAPGRRERRVAEIAREARPDLIVITGDLIRKTLTGGRRWRAARRMASYLGALQAPDGIWFVQGHGEMASRMDEEGLKEVLGAAGVRSLWDEVTLISREGSSLALAGIRVHAYGGEGRWEIDPDGRIRQGAGNRPAYLELAATGADQWADYEFTGRLRFSSPRDWAGAMVHSRLGSGQDRFYMALRRGTYPFLGASTHGTTFDSGSTTWARSMRAGAWHRFRLNVETSQDAVRLRARAWEDGAEEPAGWDLDYGDSAPTRITTGTVGVYAEGPGVKEFAELRVSALDGPGVWREPAGADFLMDLRARIPAGAPMILLSHTPDIFPEAAELGIPLTLSGHTQGGQVRLPLFGPLVTDTRSGRSRAAGLFTEGLSHLYVNRGVGTSRLPIRFLSRPEAAVLTLTGAGS